MWIFHIYFRIFNVLKAIFFKFSTFNKKKHDFFIISTTKKVFSARKMDDLEGKKCIGCQKPAKLRCPTCIKMSLPDAYFCDQVYIAEICQKLPILSMELDCIFQNIQFFIPKKKPFQSCFKAFWPIHKFSHSDVNGPYNPWPCYSVSAENFRFPQPKSAYFPVHRLASPRPSHRSSPGSRSHPPPGLRPSPARRLSGGTSIEK